MHRILRLLTIVILASSLLGSLGASPAQSAAWQSKVDPWIIDTAARGETEFIVFLNEQADLSGADRLATKQEKGDYVFQHLTETANRTQKSLLSDLSKMNVEYRSYWVANMIWVRGDMNTIQTLASRPDVAHLYANPVVKMEEPVNRGEVGPVQPQSPDGIEWNITKVKAPDLWALGYTGQGAVIAGQDTGYDWDHPALKSKYRGWDGTSANHNYNWHDSIHSGGGGVCGVNSPEPCDDHSHGTHTMGTMVGDDGGPNQIGMAPGARWIGCRNMNQGAGTPTTYMECYQFFIAPTDLSNQNPNPALAPDVINNSWGCPPEEGCTDPTMLLTTVQNVVAAGIVTAHSAGNSGSGCGSVSTPSAIYEESFTVGSTDSADNISSFSSRGPSTYGGNTYLKPNISAPGSGIRSSVPGGGYQSGWSGTSMAAPHVAGLVGLLISANPALAGQVDMLETLIENSAVPRTTSQTCGGVPGSEIPNNTYGYGRIDALAAYQSMDLHQLAISKTTSAAQASIGDTITYTLSFTHTHTSEPTTNVIVTDLVPEGTGFVSATAPYTLNGSTVEWDIPSLNAGESGSVELVVEVLPIAGNTVVNAEYSIESDDVTPVSGAPVTTIILPNTLAVSKSGPSWVLPGEPITYSLTVENTSAASIASNLVISDVLPANTSFISASEPYNLSDGVITWGFASLEPGASANVELVVQAPLKDLVLNEDYGATAMNFDWFYGAPVETQVVPFSLAVSKSAPAVAAAGSVMTYTLTVENDHPYLTQHNLALTDTLPANTEFVSASSPYQFLDGIVTWLKDDLAPGAIWQVDLAVRLPQTFTGTVTNSEYGASSDETAFTAGEPVLTQVHGLSAEKTASTASVLPGEVFTYTLTATNLHPTQAATSLLLSDTLPEQVTFASASSECALVGETVECQVASLNPGEAWTVEIAVQVKEDVSGAIINGDYSIHSAEVPGGITGEPVTTWVGYRLYLSYVANIP